MFVVRHALDGKGNLLIQDPPITQLVFRNCKASVIWLVVPVYIGYEWIGAS
jgi:hypothetical protein